MTTKRLKELETSLARAYSISGDPELVDVDEHARCYEDIQKLLDREIERQSATSGCKCKLRVCLNGTVHCPNCGRKL